MKSTNRNAAILIVFIAFFFTSISNAQSYRKRPVHRRRTQARPIGQTSAIGLKIGNDFGAQQLLLGGHLWLPVGFFWKMAPSFEYYFVDDRQKLSRWQYNLDFLFKPRPRGPLCFGGGLAVNHMLPDGIKAEFDYGGNVVLGIDFTGRRMPAMTPYVQARWSFFEDDNYFSLLGGVNFILR